MYPGFTTYSLDLREKALEYLDTVRNRQKIVKSFNISLRTLDRWIHRRSENCLPAKQRKSSPSKIDDQELRLFVREHPDAYLRETGGKFVTILQSGFYTGKRLNTSLKKDLLLRGKR